MSFRFVKTSTNKLVVSIKHGAEEVIRQLDNGRFRIKVFINHTQLSVKVEVPELAFADLLNGKTVNAMIDGTEKQVVFITGKFGGSLEDVATQIFGNAGETLLKRFSDLGIDNANLERVMKAIGKSADNGIKLAQLLEKAPFKNDLNKLRVFLSDIEKSTDLQGLVREGKDFTREWKILESYPSFRKLSTTIDKVNSILNKGHIGADDLENILTVNKGLGKRATDLANFLDDLDYFALYKNQNGFDAIISGLKANWFNGAGADDANWVIAVLRKEGTVIFNPAKTNFEIVENILGNIRRYDAIVSDAIIVNNKKVSKYFEFKSYNKVPPTDFAKQFLNDLNNPNITDLKQLEWLFDSAKKPADFTTNMKNAVDDLPFTEEMAKKFLKDVENPTISKLKKYLKDDFDNVFKLK